MRLALKSGWSKKRNLSTFSFTRNSREGNLLVSRRWCDTIRMFARVLAPALLNDRLQALTLTIGNIKVESLNVF